MNLGPILIPQTASPSNIMVGKNEMMEDKDDEFQSLH